jgi:hypothetical protein
MLLLGFRLDENQIQTHIVTNDHWIEYEIDAEPPEIKPWRELLWPQNVYEIMGAPFPLTADNEPLANETRQTHP